MAELDSHTEFQVIPNPFTDATTIILPLPLDTPTEYTIRDLLGRTVRREAVTNQEFIIDRGDLVGGVYALSVALNGGKVITRQLVIR